MTTAPRKFRGTGTVYSEIATRGDETLAMGVTYAIHHTGVGALVVRFAATSKSSSFQPMKVFSDRGHMRFLVLDDKGQDTDVKLMGLYLNKLAIPLFKPGVHPLHAPAVMDHLQLWP